MDRVVYDLFPFNQSDRQESPEYRRSLMRITVSGHPGSGTTSLAKYLQKEFGFDLISAGEVFRQLAAEAKLSLSEFGAKCEADPAVDQMIDERQKEIGEKSDDIIVEGRLSGWMVENADLRIWVTASLQCRSERISERDDLEPEDSYALTREKQLCEARRYMDYYDIDINDLSVYDLVISSEKWGAEELGSIVKQAVICLK